MRAEQEARDASPLTLYTSSEFTGGGRDLSSPTLLEHTTGALSEALRHTAQTLPPHDLQQAVERLADDRRRLLLAGGRFTGLHARYLYQHLLQMREDVHFLPDDRVTRSSSLASAGRRDVLVVYDFRRYEPELLRVAEHVHGRGGSVLLCTDTWLSPLAAVAGAVLPCHTGDFSPYDSLVPALAVTETVITGVLHALGKAARDHMRHVEDTAHATGLY